MKYSSITVLLPVLFLASTSVSAESYQSFSNANYSKGDYSNIDSEFWSLATSYFLDARETLGPLNEFDYINTVSNISAGYSHSSIDSLHSFNGSQYGSKSDDNALNINGEWFTGKFLIGGGYSYFDNDYQSRNFSRDEHFNYYRGILGYLVTDDLLIKAKVRKREGGSAFYRFDVDYNLQLNKSDYIGFGYQTDEDFDFHTLSSKYFMQLSSESYLTVGGHYTYDNYDSNRSNDSWSINSSYYFNQYSSISAGYAKDDNYSIGANHFFNKNYALAISYSTNTSDDDSDAYGINFTAQF